MLAGVVDPPDWEVLPSWEVLQARGPCSDTGEQDLMRSRRIDVLLTKIPAGR